MVHLRSNNAIIPPLYITAVAALYCCETACAEYFQIGPLPGNAPQNFDDVFSKHVDVLGLHVYATSNTPNSKVLHAANILAQWIDNNEDGEPDDALVHEKLVSLHASIIMWPSEGQADQDFDKIPDWVWDTLVMQPLFGFETNPGYPGNQWFDASLEECLHVVTWGGYSRVYPSVFGEFPGSQIGKAMDANIAGGYYHYDDPTCDYPCLVTEYHYWGLTSILGAQNYPWRIPEIIGEWELYNQKLVAKHDPALYALLIDPQWSFASVLPDGSYEPIICPADVDGSGSVDVTDILAVINGWGGSGSGDVTGDGTVDVADILAVINAWGPCP